MNKRTKVLTGNAFLVALSVIFLYGSSIVPSGNIALVGTAGLLTGVSVIEWGLMPGLLCYIVTGILAGIVVPEKGLVLIYVLFLGYYPIVKSRLERMNRVLEWSLKLLVFNAALTGTYLFYVYGFLSGIDLGGLMLYLLYGLGNLIFVIYDLGVTRLAHFYSVRIRRMR